MIYFITFCVNMSTFKKCIMAMIISTIAFIWIVGLIMDWWEWGVYEKYRWLKQD